jgi:hypothetical protein
MGGCRGWRWDHCDRWIAILLSLIQLCLISAMRAVFQYPMTDKTPTSVMAWTSLAFAAASSPCSCSCLTRSDQALSSASCSADWSGLSN